MRNKPGRKLYHHRYTICFQRHSTVMSLRPVLVPLSSPEIPEPCPSLKFHVDAIFPLGSNSSLFTVTFTSWFMPTTIDYEVLSQQKISRAKWAIQRSTTPIIVTDKGNTPEIGLTPSLPCHLSVNRGTKHSSMTSSATLNTSSNLNISLAPSLPSIMSR